MLFSPFSAYFSSGMSARRAPACVALFRANVRRKLAAFALIVIRNWSLFCLCSVQSLISGGATVEQHSLCVSHTDLGSAPRTALMFTCFSFLLVFFSFYSLLSATSTAALTCTETFNAPLNLCSWTQAVNFFPQLNVLCGLCRRPLRCCCIFQ